MNEDDDRVLWELRHFADGLLQHADMLPANLAAMLRDYHTDLHTAPLWRWYGIGDPVMYQTVADRIAREVTASARESGRTVGVVSNNSARVVKDHLERHDLSAGVRLVSARTVHDPTRLKPNPHLIDIALRCLEANQAAATLVGESFTDIEAVHRANVASVGYANKPGKRARMIQLHVGAVINNMADLALSLRTSLVPGQM